MSKCYLLFPGSEVWFIFVTWTPSRCHDQCGDLESSFFLHLVIWAGRSPFGLRRHSGWVHYTRPAAASHIDPCKPKSLRIKYSQQLAPWTHHTFHYSEATVCSTCQYTSLMFTQSSLAQYISGFSPNVISHQGLSNTWQTVSVFHDLARDCLQCCCLLSDLVYAPGRQRSQVFPGTGRAQWTFAG